MRVEVGVHCCTRNVMRSVLIRYSEDRLRIVPGGTYKRTHNLGRHPILNCDGVRKVFLADEMERDGGTERTDMVPPKRCKSVSVIVPDIPIIANAKQPPLQKPDDGGCHDPRVEWIPAVASEVVQNLKA